MAVKSLQERRKVPRVDFLGRVEINLLHPGMRLKASSLNLSEAGICVRLQEALDIHSPVKLRLFAASRKRPLECGGRVAWVVQRLDLRDTPPFVYDVGVEFVDPPPRLRQLVARTGITVKPKGLRPPRGNFLQPVWITGRCYVPRVERELSPSVCWHLVVSVEGTPCFSQRFSTGREALEAWHQFKRKASKPPVPEVHR